jgi:hypothetical protein
MGKGGRVKEIPLANGRGVALVDDEDYDWLMQYNWHLHIDTSVKHKVAKYAHTNIWIEGNRTVRSMHVLIMKLDDGRVVDHKDRDGLNNQRHNLRPAWPYQSAANRDTSSYRKVSQYRCVRKAKDCPNRPWFAQIRFNGKLVTVGYYESELKAAEAADRLAIIVFGEFAVLNFPDNDYSVEYETEKRWSGFTAEQILEEIGVTGEQ